MPRLTKRVVDAAEIRPTDYFIWCSEMPGFGVRIYPSGKRGYLAQYRVDGRTRRVKIGLHGVLTVDQARTEAIGHLASVAKGGNPAEDRATRRQGVTVCELCDRYWRAAEKGLILGKSGGPKKPGTLYRDKSRVDCHILPLLGTRKVADLTRADVTRFMRDVAAGKTAKVEKTAKLRGKTIVEGGKGTATRTMGLLGGILSFGVSEGCLAVNPVHGVKRPADQRRTARLTPETYGKLGEALRLLEAEKASEIGLAAIRLLALTGCRRGEIEQLRWAEIDLEGCALRLADTKEGASVRPLGEAARDLLRGLPRVKGCEFVLPGRSDNTAYGGLARLWRRVGEKVTLEGMTLHGLRHSFASTAGDLGYTEATIGAMLGHSSGTVTGRYVHHLDAVLIAAADKVTREIAAAMEGPRGD
jgi:integrase